MVKHYLDIAVEPQARHPRRGGLGEPVSCWCSRTLPDGLAALSVPCDEKCLKLCVPCKRYLRGDLYTVSSSSLRLTLPSECLNPPAECLLHLSSSASSSLIHFLSDDNRRAFGKSWCQSCAQHGSLERLSVSCTIICGRRDVFTGTRCLECSFSDVAIVGSA